MRYCVCDAHGTPPKELTTNESSFTRHMIIASKNNLNPPMTLNSALLYPPRMPQLELQAKRFNTTAHDP